jgi:hypothetical protein
MSVLRWVLLAALAFAFVLLAVSNWTMVDFILPSGAALAVPLPILLGAAFIGGVIPTWAWLSLLRPLAGKSPPKWGSRRPIGEQTDIAPSLSQPGL